MKRDSIEPIVLLLFMATVFFVMLLVAVDWLFKGEGQVFQVVAGLATGTGAAFLARMKPADTVPPPGSVQATVTQTPPDPKP